MTQRQLVQAGIRILGFWLLVTALLRIASSAWTGANSFVSLRSDPTVDRVGVFSVSFHTHPGELTDDIAGRWQRMNAWTSWQMPLVTALLQAGVALYLCRSGRWVIDFLVPEGKALAED